MFEYAVYVRTTKGDIVRMNNIISNLPYDPRGAYGSLAPYVHEEELLGFPESVVLWENSTGSSVGIAPLTLTPALPISTSPLMSVRAKTDGATSLPWVK